MCEKKLTSLDFHKSKQKKYDFCLPSIFDHSSKYLNHLFATWDFFKIPFCRSWLDLFFCRKYLLVVSPLPHGHHNMWIGYLNMLHKILAQHKDANVPLAVAKNRLKLQAFECSLLNLVILPSSDLNWNHRSRAHQVNKYCNFADTGAPTFQVT